MVLHVEALEPVLDVAAGVVGAALGLGAMPAGRLPVDAGHFLVRQDCLDGAMHQQVRIAPDRRSEVRVGLEREAEMADVIRRVDRLLERAQQDGLQQQEIGPRADLLQDLRVILRLGLLAARQHQPELGEERAQRGDFLRRRHVVHAVERGMTPTRKEIAGADVRRQHAFLDQAMRLVAHLRHDAQDLALGVKLHSRLDRIEVDRAAPGALLEQRLEELVQGLQLGARAAVGERLPDAGVGKPRLRAEHRRVELVARDAAIRRDRHVADHRQAVHVRIQRAQAVGDLLRQHRDHAAREIHRGAALQRIRIERVAGPHVVADIGDRDAQAEACIFPSCFPDRVHRVVEILRRFAVDGDERKIP